MASNRDILNKAMSSRGFQAGKNRRAARAWGEEVRRSSSAGKVMEGNKGFEAGQRRKNQRKARANAASIKGRLKGGLKQRGDGKINTRWYRMLKRRYMPEMSDAQWNALRKAHRMMRKELFGVPPGTGLLDKAVNSSAFDRDKHMLKWKNFKGEGTKEFLKLYDEIVGDKKKAIHTADKDRVLDRHSRMSPVAAAKYILRNWYLVGYGPDGRPR